MTQAQLHLRNANKPNYVMNILMEEAKNGSDYSYLNSNGIYVSKPIIDWVTICFDLSSHKHAEGILKQCTSLKDVPYPGIIPTYKIGFRRALKVFMPTGNVMSERSIRVYFGPYYSKASFVQIEFNPSWIVSEHYEYLEKFLFDFMDINLPEHLKKAHITHLDACIDVRGIDIEDWAFFPQKKRLTTCMFGYVGKLETLCMGKRGGSQVKIYDKAKELKSDGKLVRIEVSVKNLCPKQLPNLKNPFLSLKVYDLRTEHKGGNKVMFELLKDSIRYRGFKCALKRLPEFHRHKYKKLFAEISAEWWNPKRLWEEHWQSSLLSAGLLPEQWLAKKFVIGGDNLEDNPNMTACISSIL